jgi:F0F1-type ATP synthase membrane subunit a
MKYKKFLLLPSILILYILFVNLISIDYEVYGTSYSVIKNPLSSNTNEEITTSHQLEVIVKRHRILFGLLPSYGFRSMGFARGSLILYNPGSLKDFHIAFLIFFTILAISLFW